MWLELLKSLPSVVTAITAIVGVFLGIRGLEKWRTEAVGKRRIELAEDVLADFYEARDNINAARSPAGFANEGSTRPRREGETENETRMLNAYYAVAERLNKRNEFFARLEARRYRFIALFGMPAAAPYQELRAIHSDILVAIRMLLATQKRGTAASNIAKWESTIWDNDPIRPRLDAMVEAIEKLCRPVIQRAPK
jgi:hypothetical protein